MLGVFGQDPKKDEALVTEYRNTFSGPAGRKVFCHMLTELGLFDQVLDTEAERARQDYAKRLLMLCGIWLPQNIENIVSYLLNMPIVLEKEER